MNLYRLIVLVNRFALGPRLARRQCGDYLILMVFEIQSSRSLKIRILIYIALVISQPWHLSPTYFVDHDQICISGRIWWVRHCIPGGLADLYLLMQLITRDVYLKVHAREEVGPSQFARRIRKQSIPVVNCFRAGCPITGLADGRIFLRGYVKVRYAVKSKSDPHALLFSGEPATVSG